MLKVRMVKWSAFKAAPGVPAWEYHVLSDEFISEPLAVLTARDMARSVGCYVAAQINTGRGFFTVGCKEFGEWKWDGR